METKQINISTLSKNFADEDKARELLENLRWHGNPICPHCDAERAYKLEPKTESSKMRKGVYKCRKCRKQFTVTVGTIFEGSRIPLSKWLMAIHLICSSKKGISALQLSRNLDLTYKTAWFMAHRVRYAMSQEPLRTKLKGVVEADETYIGGTPTFAELLTHPHDIQNTCTVSPEIFCGHCARRIGELLKSHATLTAEADKWREFARSLNSIAFEEWSGHYQDDVFWIFDYNGDGVASGKDAFEAYVNIAASALAEIGD